MGWIKRIFCGCEEEYVRPKKMKRRELEKEVRKLRGELNSWRYDATKDFLKLFAYMDLNPGDKEFVICTPGQHSYWVSTYWSLVKTYQLDSTTYELWTKDREKKAAPKKKAVKKKKKAVK